MASGDAAAMIRLRTCAVGSGGLRMLFYCLWSLAYRSSYQSARQTVTAVRERLWQGRREGDAIDPANRSGGAAFAKFRPCRSLPNDPNANDSGTSRWVHFIKLYCNPSQKQEEWRSNFREQCGNSRSAPVEKESCRMNRNRNIHCHSLSTKNNRHMNQRRVILVLMLAANALAGCNREPTPEEKWEKAVTAATGATAMWYRFTFRAEYQGKAFGFDQMIYCPTQVFSGGRLGQSPSTVMREATPMTIAQKMEDGSQVLVRIPNMCQRYRKFGKNTVGTAYMYYPGWRSSGPHPILPLIIWSDKIPRPERIESYVSSEYYKDPRARIKNPVGALDLWPAGRYPKNYQAIMRQQRALPLYPDPWVNPSLDPARHGGGRDGRYHGKGDRFVSYAIVPIVNYNEWVAKYGGLVKIPFSREAGQPSTSMDGVFIDAGNYQETAMIEADPSFNHARFRMYRLPQDEQLKALHYEPTFLTSRCVSESLGLLMQGSPGISQFPIDAKDWGSAYPDLVRQRLYEHYASPQHLERVKNSEARMRNCYAQLGKLKSFDVINRRLDATDAISGAIVYHKWLAESDGWGYIPPSKRFVKSGAVAGTTFRMRFHDQEFDYALKGSRGELSVNVALEDKGTHQWFYIYSNNIMFSGETESSGF